MEPGQLLINWALQRGTIVLPKSVTPERIVQNTKTFPLPQSAVDTLAKLDRHERYNFPKRLGVNIFGEWSEEDLKAAVQEWVESQRALKK